MPHYTTFIKSEMDGASNSLYGYPDSSHREPDLSTGDEVEYYSRCRWFGEDFFKFSLKMAIFKKSKVHTTADDLKLEMTQAEIDFPYLDFIEKLDAMKPTRIPEDANGEKPRSYTTFITKLGFVADRVDNETRNQLAFMIQNQGGVASKGMNADSAMLSSSPPPGEDSAGGDKSIALCSSKLQEWATRNHKSMSWSGEQISVDPISNEVKVLVDGEEFVARAKKQKTAKHIACKEACERFGIMV